MAQNVHKLCCLDVFRVKDVNDDNSRQFTTKTGDLRSKVVVKVSSNNRKHKSTKVFEIKRSDH